MKGDIGMANYEKQVEQEAAYPIPISLYNCYRTARQEKRGIILLIAFLMPHCPVTVVQRYRDGGMQPLVPLVFHNLPSLYPPSFRRNDFLYLYTYIHAPCVAYKHTFHHTSPIMTVCIMQ